MTASIALQGALRQVSAEIDKQLDGLLAIPDDPRADLYRAMRHAAMGGGKRLRPLLGVRDRQAVRRRPQVHRARRHPRWSASTSIR